VEVSVAIHASNGIGTYVASGVLLGSIFGTGALHWNDAGGQAFHSNGLLMTHVTQTISCGNECVLALSLKLVQQAVDPRTPQLFWTDQEVRVVIGNNYPQRTQESFIKYNKVFFGDRTIIHYCSFASCRP
jgi:hypothetical protein